jgi:hypothetical protein
MFHRLLLRYCAWFGVAACMISAASAQVQIIDNDANAAMLANQAKSLVRHPQKSSDLMDSNDRLRDNRGSQINDTPREADCGGIAIGNVRPIQGDHRQHTTTVIIRGNVINANNKC